MNNNNLSICAVCESEHDTLDESFEEYQSYKQTDLIRAREKFLEFKSRLERHILCEEQIIFPLYELKFGMQERQTSALREEHQRIRQLMNLLDGRKSMNNYEEKLLIILGQHFLKEESVILPALDQILTGDEKALLIQKIHETSCAYLETKQVEPETLMHEESGFPIILP